MGGTSESRGQRLTYLDTHAALWLCTCEVPLSPAALSEIEIAELRLSPMVVLEMQFLYEIKRINADPGEWLRILERDFDVAVCQFPFPTIIQVSLGELWTRDPFDRLIVAHAKAAGGKLITRDQRIHDNFKDSVW